jgi:hypothetical protein
MTTFKLISWSQQVILCRFINSFQNILHLVSSFVVYCLNITNSVTCLISWQTWSFVPKKSCTTKLNGFTLQSVEFPRIWIPHCRYFYGKNMYTLTRTTEMTHSKLKTKIYRISYHEGRGGVEVQLYSSFNLGARCKWVVNASPLPFYSLVWSGTHYIEGSLTPRVGLDWCGKSHRTGIRSPDCPARSESLYWQWYRGPP